MKYDIKQWIALVAGLACGWFVIHLIVTNWGNIKALIM